MTELANAIRELIARATSPQGDGLDRQQAARDLLELQKLINSAIRLLQKTEGGNHD